MISIKQKRIVINNQNVFSMLKIYTGSIRRYFLVKKEDFKLSPLNSQGGLSKMWQLFREQTEEIISELNEALAA